MLRRNLQFRATLRVVAIVGNHYNSSADDVCITPGNPILIGIVKKQTHYEHFKKFYGRFRSKPLSWANIAILTSQMFSKEYGGIDARQVHFYGNAGVCLFKYFVTMNDPQLLFAWGVLCVNTVCFVAITFAYFMIHFINSKSTEELGGRNKQLKSRSKRLQRKVTIIIVTDFLCWIPFIFICLLHSVEVIDATRYYDFFSIVLLPINSVINPLLYDGTVNSLISKLLMRLVRRTGDDGHL
eukprot:sb/3469110/